MRADAVVGELFMAPEGVKKIVAIETLKTSEVLNHTENNS